MTNPTTSELDKILDKIPEIDVIFGLRNELKAALTHLIAKEKRKVIPTASEIVKRLIETIQVSELGNFPEAVPEHYNWVNVYGKVFVFHFDEFKRSYHLSTPPGEDK